MELFIACIQKDINKINRLLENNEYIIYLSDNDGNTVGHLCAIYKIYDILIDLVKKYPKLIMYLNDNGKSLIHLIDDCDILESIIDLIIDNNMTEELDAIPYDGKTLLISALHKYNNNRDYISIIKKLLKIGIRLDIPSDNPPLNIYMENNPNIRITTLLLEAGADPNLKNKYGLNSLIIGVLNNVNVDIIRLLLDYGADINYSGPEDRFLPLIISLKKGYNNITEILIQYNPDLSHQDNNLNTPLHYAIISNKRLPRDLIKYFIYNGDLNIPNINGQTPLHYLIISKKWNKYYDVIKNKELNFSAVDNNNRTPLFYMNGQKLIQTINSLSNNVLRNEIKKKCLNENNTINYKCIEPLRSLIKNNLIENSGNEIEIPDVVDTDYGIFGTNILHNVIYMVQILKKYENVFIPFQYFLPEKCLDQIIKLNDLNLYRTKHGEILHNILSIYTENLFEIAPSTILWHSKDIRHHDKNLRIYIKKLLDSDGIRFIVMKLTLIPVTNMSHANIIIYDKKTKIVERFEPYGSLNYYIKDIDKLDLYLHKIFKKSIDKDVIYKSPQDYMKKVKFQLISSESDPENKKLGDPSGYCLAWCYWFLELKFKNPDYDTEELIKKTLSKIINDNDSNGDNNVMNYIRKYGKKLDLLKNDFLTNIGFTKKEHYNVAYNNSKLGILFDNISKEINKMIEDRIK